MFGTKDFNYQRIHMIEWVWEESCNGVPVQTCRFYVCACVYVKSNDIMSKISMFGLYRIVASE